VWLVTRIYFGDSLRCEKPRYLVLSTRKYAHKTTSALLNTNSYVFRKLHRPLLRKVLRMRTKIVRRMTRPLRRSVAASENCKTRGGWIFINAAKRFASFQLTPKTYFAIISMSIWVKKVCLEYCLQPLFASSSRLSPTFIIFSGFYFAERSKKTEFTFLNCVYCSQLCKTPEKLISHMNEAHLFSKYQCPYCDYRACRPAYVFYHLVRKRPFIII